MASTAGAADEALAHDAAVLAQQEQIAADIAAEQPLLGAREAPDVLRAEYADNPQFAAGVEAVCARFSGLRRVRGDGNCFYRALLFGLCERIVQAGDADTLRAALLARLDRAPAELEALGYDPLAFEIFYDAFRALIEGLPGRSVAELEATFNDPEEANYVVWFCRLLAAAFMKADEPRFAMFVEGLLPGATVADFCAREVEPMGKECDQPQVLALVESLGIGVQIEYLDGRGAAGVTTMVFPDGAEPVVVLIFRPGHYELLY